MSNTLKIINLIIACLLSVSSEAVVKDAISDSSVSQRIKWDNSLCMPSLDGQRNKGVAGAFSGFIGDELLIAGGANFPDALPWKGGHKTWSRDLYLLNTKTSKWTVLKNTLPTALAYGVSIELPEGILCIGGCDSQRCYSEVFLIQIKDRKVEISIAWPSLPVPLSNATGVVLNNCIYIAGGQESMQKQESTNRFYKLDLTFLEKGWQELPAWPGAPRGYAVSVVQNDGSGDCLYLFSGRDYRADGTINVLTDGYAYNPESNTWKKLDRQFPVMSGSAIAFGTDQILFLGGVPCLIPGSDTHPGFDNSVRLYHTITNEMIVKEIVPYPIPVTTNTIRKGNVFYITSGEVKPGIRTPFLLRGEIMSF